MTQSIVGSPELASVAQHFPEEEQRTIAVIQYNLKHMPVDNKQTLIKGEMNWKYWGDIDGNWASMDAAAVSICSGRLENMFGLPPGLTFSTKEACRGNLGTERPDHLGRLAVYTTELRRRLQSYTVRQALAAGRTARANGIVGNIAISHDQLAVVQIECRGQTPGNYNDAAGIHSPACRRWGR